MQFIHANGDNPDDHSLNHPIGVPDALEGEKIPSSTKFPSHASQGPSALLRGRGSLSSPQRWTARQLCSEADILRSGDRPALWLAGASTAPTTPPSAGLASTPAPPAPARPSPGPAVGREAIGPLVHGELHAAHPGCPWHSPSANESPRASGHGLDPPPRLPSHPQRLRVLHLRSGQPPADARGHPPRSCCVT